MSITQFVNELTVNQLEHTQSLIADRLRQAQESGRRIVWRVLRDESLVEHNFREEEFDKAADLLMSIYKEEFVGLARHAIAERTGNAVRLCERCAPSIAAEIVTQLEYETEWFPDEQGGTGPTSKPSETPE